MSKEKLFALYLSKNPLLSNDKVTLTQAGLKKFFETTYNVAYKQGFNQLPDSDEEEEDDYYNPPPSPQRTGKINGLEDLMKIFNMT
jgi:hypothetical protein